MFIPGYELKLVGGTLDERFQCRILMRYFKIGKADGEHLGCPYHGRCHLATSSPGHLCAVDDPAFVFKPGWDLHSTRHLSYNSLQFILEDLPGLRHGDAFPYFVGNDDMYPSIEAGAYKTIVRKQKIVFDGEVYLLLAPLNDKYAHDVGVMLRRVYLIGDNDALLVPDNSRITSDSFGLEEIRVLGIVMDDRVEIHRELMAFDAGGVIVPLANLLPAYKPDERIPLAVSL